MKKILFLLIISFNCLFALTTHDVAVDSGVLERNYNASSCSEAIDMFHLAYPDVYNYATGLPNYTAESIDPNYIYEYYVTGSYDALYPVIECTTFLNGSRTDEKVKYKARKFYHFQYNFPECVPPTTPVLKTYTSATADVDCEVDKLNFSGATDLKCSCPNLETMGIYTATLHGIPCADGTYWDKNMFECMQVPECPLDNDFFDVTGNPPSCKCNIGYILLEGSCQKDDDGDGIPNDKDPNSPDYLKDPNDCKGFNTYDKYFYPSNPIFPISDYKYVGETGLNDCKDKLLNAQIDSTYEVGDVNPTCEKNYCFVHYVGDDTCTATAAGNLPSGYIYKADAKTENQCLGYVDGVKYSNMIFDVPMGCPATSFCYLKPILDSNTSSPTVNSDDTSADNKAIVDGQNITNNHLSEIKADVKGLLGNSASLLASTEDLNTKLSDLNLKTDKSLSNQDLMNSSLTNINKSVNDMSSLLTSSLDGISGKLDSIDSKLNNLGSIDDSLKNGLFGDDPFADVDFTDDGSSTFGDLEGTATDALSLTEESHLFGLSSIGSSGLQTVSFSFYGHTMTIFEPSMLNGFPMVEIKALFLFFFAIAGFITVFRTV